MKSRFAATCTVVSSGSPSAEARKQSRPPKNHGAAGYTPEEFHYTFTNTLTREESDKVYARYHIPAPGNWVWAYGVLANYTPASRRPGSTTRSTTAPRCSSSAAARTTSCPHPSTRRNAHKYAKSTALTDYYEFEGRDHWTAGAPGWEAVADKALEWAVAHASSAHLRINA